MGLSMQSYACQTMKPLKLNISMLEYHPGVVNAIVRSLNRETTQFTKVFPCLNNVSIPHIYNKHGGNN